VKRAPLQRKKPMRRVGRIKRKWRKKPKARNYYDSIKDDRNAWKASLEQRCWVCGRNEHDLRLPERLEIHELIPRSAAPNRWWERFNGALCCSSCHAQHGHAGKDIEWLARKFRFDRDNYDLKEWLMLRNPRAMNFIVQREVDCEVARQMRMES
jgi:5-methylcytosine-specific restriction endonuclease McrA